MNTIRICVLSGAIGMMKVDARGIGEVEAVGKLENREMERMAGASPFLQYS